jgi:amino acid transporter
MSAPIKRLLLGRPISTHAELHHRLPKRIALAVFSSDALSSSAYATDEILLVLLLGGAAALKYSTWVATAVVVVLAIVIFSYRQTVEAYPLGGGAYRVSHDNLGPQWGLIAAGALLIDYVLTVAVSTAAGVAAVGAAFPAVREHRVFLALTIVTLITGLNLRGLKESGTVFAVPTYGFLISMGLMIVLGTAKVLLGHAPPVPPVELAAAQPVTLFLILRAFASGSTALTGVEAISDGVPAFKPPESKNASQTLLTLGIILAILFSGITFLSHAFHVNPALIEQGHTVTSQIAQTVFGRGSVMFYAVQAFTALILFLAANTSYADFPRLASILSRDRYLPSVMKNRGDRLAFSNGIIILALAAAGVLVNYGADVHRIIPLYVVGVFTSFTLSQLGMVVRMLKLRKAAEALGKPSPAGWRRKVIISAIGSATTFVVLIIVGVTKFLTPLQPGQKPHFRGGAWQVILLVIIVAWALKNVKKHYLHVGEELELDPDAPPVRVGKVVLLVTRFAGTTKAMAFARTLPATDLKVVALGTTEVRLTNLRNRWKAMGITTPIEPLGSRIADVIGYVRGMGPTPQEPITVLLPDAHYRKWFEQVRKNGLYLRLKRAFLFERGTVLISVPFQPESEPEPTRLQQPGRLDLVVLVSSVHKATLRAVQYARSLNPASLKAVSIQTEPGEAAKLTDVWGRLQVDVPLEVIDSPYRSLVEPVVRELRELHPNPEDAVGVVIPEFLVPHWWQSVLHTQTALWVKVALLFEPDVIVIDVPYRVGDPEGRRSKERAAAALKS